MKRRSRPPKQAPQKSSGMTFEQALANEVTKHRWSSRGPIRLWVTKNFAKCAAAREANPSITFADIYRAAVAAGELEQTKNGYQSLYQSYLAEEKQQRRRA